jgi:hypothetical protein
MEVKVTWLQDEEHLDSFGNDFLQYRSKTRKWTVQAGILVLITGASILGYVIFMGINFRLAPIIPVFGIAMIVWHFWDKSKWFNLMRSSQSYKELNEVIFTPQLILHTGPTSKGEISWEGIADIVSENSGLFLILQKGISVYIPKSSASNESEYNDIIKLYEAHA